MREKLIELFFDYQEKYNSLVPSKDGLADHILADGWIRLPCKVGDVLYEVDGEHGVVRHKITDLIFAANSIATDDKGSIWADCWQAEEIKNAPKTREEAEAALKEG